MIRQSLREKEVMLKEIHHRVKNNLSIISSLLYLQSEQIGYKEQALDAFEKSRQRIQSMAQVHEKLYRTENLVEINMKEYIQEMSNNLIQTLRTEPEVKFQYHLENIHLDINRAVPCGLILNELITNALKHAFTGRRSGLIQIELKESDNGRHELAVQDNGVGLPPHVNVERVHTLGFQIINTLVDQIDGRLSLETEEGTRFKVQFPVK